MRTAYLALGANLGDAPATLRAALEHLAQTPNLRLVQVSRFYRSAPLGPPDQPDYCNAVCAIETALAPEALLESLHAIEDAFGRARSQRWAARTLDLDLLWIDGFTRATPQLELPHPRLHERAFVLVPLAELAPQLEIPGRGRIESLAAAIDRRGLALWV